MKDKFNNIKRSFVRRKIKNLIGDEIDRDIARDEFEGIRPWLEKAFELGKKDVLAEVNKQ